MVFLGTHTTNIMLQVGGALDFTENLCYNNYGGDRMVKYLSNVITDEDLNKINPGEFNIIKAPPGYGKTTFMFDDRILKFSRAKKHVLYLI